METNKGNSAKIEQENITESENFNKYKKYFEDVNYRISKAKTAKEIERIIDDCINLIKPPTYVPVDLQQANKLLPDYKAIGEFALEHHKKHNKPFFKWLKDNNLFHLGDGKWCTLEEMKESNKKYNSLKDIQHFHYSADDVLGYPLANYNH